MESHGVIKHGVCHDICFFIKDYLFRTVFKYLLIETLFRLVPAMCLSSEPHSPESHRWACCYMGTKCSQLGHLPSLPPLPSSVLGDAREVVMKWRLALSPILRLTWACASYLINPPLST